MPIQFLHEICKAKKYEGQEVLYVQQKFDGHRITAIKQPNGCDTPLVLYTRSQSNLYIEIAAKAARHNIWPWLINLVDIPPYTSVDGELYVQGKPASYVKTAIKNCDPALKFVAFAVPWLNKQRRYTDPLEWAMDQATVFGIPFIPFIKLGTTESINPDEWIRKAKPETEGWMLKKHHYVSWYKLKRQRTIDLVVLGVTKGKGKYEGQTGSLVCGAYDPYNVMREVCLCSGMTDEERAKLSENDIGRTCEVQYQEVASLGRLRHPIFLRWRDDEKKPYDCTLAQEPELLRYWVENT